VQRGEREKKTSGKVGTESCDRPKGGGTGSMLLVKKGCLSPGSWTEKEKEGGKKGGSIPPMKEKRKRGGKKKPDRSGGRWKGLRGASISG